MNDDPLSVFVYGTLKRGQSREISWPRKPLSIHPATVRGALYDLGPYPGLTEGDDRIAGELWQFAPDDMPSTLTALDEIEGYHGCNNDEYRRVMIECTIGEVSTTAWIYLYARQSVLASARRVTPNDRGVCQWQAAFS
jgi:gamma-glutamylcyclotransferase (GGCT)/AIG2-like uncharacterized protein YtfP